MLQTVYFNNKKLVLTDARELVHQKEYSGAMILDNPGRNEIKKLMPALPKETVILVDQDFKRVWTLLEEQTHTVQAAGGLVTNPSGALLLIFRRGKWDLPKGKLDEGEDLEACALREVEEETGLSDLELKKPLLVTYHTYPEKGKLVLKESHWYLMQNHRHQDLVPQTDEDIEKCEWVAANKLVPYLDNSHPSIVDVIRKGIKELNLTT